MYAVEPNEPVAADPIVVVREDEATTRVLPREAADALALAYDFVAAWIALEVHSALEAFGLTRASGPSSLRGVLELPLLRQPGRTLRHSGHPSAVTASHAVTTEECDTAP